MEPSKRLLGSGAQTSRVQILVAAALLIALLVVGSAGAFQDDFNSYTTTDLYLQSGYFDSTGSQIGDMLFYDGVDRLSFGESNGPTNYWTVNTSVDTGPLYYAAWTLNGNSFIQIDFYDENHVLITDVLLWYTYCPQPCRVEIKRIGQTWKAYCNGYFHGNYITTATDTHFIRLYGSSGSLDNLVLTDVGNEPYIIGGPPAGWYVRKDMLSALTKGLYNETGDLMSSFFHSDFGVSTPGTYTINLRHYSGALWNTTSWTASYVNATGGLQGNISYNIDDILIDAGAPYGMYEMELVGPSGGILDTTWFYYIATGADIQWDRETYSAGDDAVLSTTVSAGYWDTSTYSYEGRIYDLYGTLKDSWTISSITDTETVSLLGYDTGDYVAAIVATTISGGTEYWMDYDTATITDKVNILGHTVNAYSGGVVPLASVSFIQGGTFHNSVSAADGSFSETGLLWGSEIGVNATKTGFNFTPFKFTPPAAGTYTLNLSLLPDYIPNSTAIAGVVYDDWSHNAIPGATVWISNSTWTGTSTTATSMGFYMFDGLAAGESYLINATAAGYAQSADYSRSPIAGLHIVQDIEMTSSYILTVYIRDATTNSLIMDTVFVESSDGQIKNTTTGSTTFTLGFGAYTITGSSSGYTGSSTAVLMTGNRDITLYLTKTTAQPTKQIYIAPHEVRFVVHDIYGAAIPDVAVTAVGWASSMPDPAGWLLELFGINTATTPTNSTMAGTTGTDGSIVFIMFPAYKYNITFTKAGYNIPIQYIWPKEDQYLITAMPIAQPSTTELNWTLWQVPVGANQVKVGLDFNDTGAATTSLEFYVRDTNKATVYHEQFFSLGWAQPNYTITIGPNQYWYWGFNAMNTNFAENITADQYLATETRRVNLPIPDFFQNLMSVAFIVIVMGLSGTENRRQVMVFDSFFGIFLTGIGVFPAMNNIIGWPLLFMALGFSVLYYMRTGERKEGT